MSDELDINSGRIAGKSTNSDEPSVKIAGKNKNSVSTQAKISGNQDKKSSFEKKEVENDNVNKSTIRDRISIATKEKGLKSLPQSFGDSDGDWQIIESKNLFVVLYLDPKEIISINPDIVKNNFALISDFWKEKKKYWESGSGQVRESIENKYKKKNLESCFTRLDKAYSELSTIEKINSYFNNLERDRVEKGKSLIKKEFDKLVRDGDLTKTDFDILFEMQNDIDLSEDEIANIIYEFIKLQNLVSVMREKGKGWIPLSVLAGKSTKEKITSVIWMTEAIIKNQPAIMSIEILPNKHAETIEEIGEILFENENKAKEYIVKGYIANSVNKFSIPKADQINEIYKQNDSEHLIYLQIIYLLNPNLPFKFNSQNYSNPKELSFALYEYPEIGKQYFKQENITVWLKSCHFIDYQKIKDIRKNAKNEDLAFIEFLYTLNSELPYSFNNANYLDIKELTIALFENAKSGLEHYKKGYIEIWQKICFPAEFEIINKINETADKTELAFLEIIYTFSPELPYRLVLKTLNSKLPFDEILINNTKDLVEKIDTNIDGWNSGKEALYNGSILVWLNTNGKTEITKKWQSEKENYKDNKDAGLEFFLHLLNDKLEYPKIVINIKSFSYPGIQSGDKISTSFTITNKTRGFIDGNLEFSRRIVGVTVSNETFYLNVACDITTFKINLTIDSDVLIKGVDYNTSIIIKQEKSDQIEIPVTFRLVFPKNAFIKQLLKCAAIFALFGGIIRGGWFLLGFKNWIKIDYPYYLSRLDVGWQTKPQIYFFPLIFLLMLIIAITLIKSWQAISSFMDYNKKKSN